MQTPAAQPDSRANACAGRRQHWAVVLAGVLFARLFINHPMIVQTYGTLLVPLSLQMHADRGALSMALALHLFCMGLVAPAYGVLIDRFGVRRVLVPCLLVTGILLACVSRVESLQALIAAYALMGLAGAAAAPTAWSKLVTMVIDKRRGLALSALTTTGGVGGALMPIVAGALIAAFGWRGTYVWLGLMMILGTVPVLLAVTSPAGPIGVRLQRSTNSSLMQILSRRQFWAMVVPACAIGVSVSGLAVHYIPMLLDRGVPLQQATALNALPGLMLVATALVFGYFLDRTRPALAGTVLSFISATGFLMLALGDGLVVVIGAALAGCAGGAEIGLVAYLCTRYFAPEDFGKTYGLAFFFWVLSQSVGAAAFGFGYAATGNYLAPLLVTAGALVLAPLALTWLGPYLFHGPAVRPADSSGHDKDRPQGAVRAARSGK